MLDHRKLSSKINYSVLAELFEDGGGGGEEEGGEGARRRGFLQKACVCAAFV